MIHRRTLLRGLFAMPAIVAASSLMPLRGLVMPWQIGARWNGNDYRTVSDAINTLLAQALEVTPYGNGFRMPPHLMHTAIECFVTELISDPRLSFHDGSHGDFLATAGGRVTVDFGPRA